MKILMIEDQRHFAEMVVHSLEGLNIEVVDTLAAAKERLNKGGYDLILVDLGLPDSQGTDTLRALKGYKVPKVVLTGRFDIPSDAIGLGYTDFIYKTDPAEVYERIMFNVSKIERKKRPRFAPEVFSQIRACFERSPDFQLTTA